MKKLIVMAMILGVITGCGDIRVVRDHNYNVYENDSQKYIKSYKIGEKHTTFIGDPLVRWQLNDVKIKSLPRIYVPITGFELDGKYIKRDVFSSNININSNANDFFYYRGSTSYEGVNYIVIGRREAENKYHLLINDKGLLNKNILIDQHLDRKLISADATITPKEVIFVEGPKEKISYKPGITREIIFGGVNNVTLNATYREYTPDDLARQAFYQNLVYQTTADIIRFRDFKIKIHEVTNEKIIFTVLEDGLKDPVLTPSSE